MFNLAWLYRFEDTSVALAEHLCNEMIGNPSRTEPGSKGVTKVGLRGSQLEGQTRKRRREFLADYSRSHKRFNSSSLASTASRLTLHRDISTVSAISGSTARYCRVDTPRNRISSIRPPNFSSLRIAS